MHFLRMWIFVRFGSPLSISRKHMKILNLLLIASTLLSCKQAPFPKPSIENLKYAAFRWGYNDLSDSFEFYLAHYIEIGANGHYTAMRHNPLITRKVEYFEGNLKEDFRKAINGTFRGDSLKEAYLEDSASTALYNGYTYCFDYLEKDSASRKQIQFIPRYSPYQIRTLADDLDDIIFYATKSAPPLALDAYCEYLKQLNISETGPLPKMQPTVYFTIPQLNKRNR